MLPPAVGRFGVMRRYHLHRRDHGADPRRRPQRWPAYSSIAASCPDILTEDAEWLAWSSAALAEADAAPLVINAVLFAEISVRFSTIEELDARLPRDTFVREPIPFEAAFLAGRAFLR